MTLPALSRRQDFLIGLVLVCCAFALYCVRLGYPDVYVYDEAYHAYTAEELVKGHAAAYWWDGPMEGRRAANGQQVFTTWTHPPLSRDVMQNGIRLLGFNPLGWRIMSALCGALGIGLLFLLGRKLFGTTTGIFAAILLLCDGLWFVQSRTAMLDIFLATFLLLSYFLFSHYRESAGKARYTFLALTAMATGLALATKWSAVYSWLGLALWAAYNEATLNAPQKGRRSLFCLAAFTAIPLAEYLVAYGQFFLMGYSLPDWVELQGMMFNYHTTLQEQHVWSSPWWSWPLMLRPVWYYTRDTTAGIEQLFAMGNPILWWSFLLAIPAVAWKWKSCRFEYKYGLVLAGFLLNWLPWVLSPRIAFIYHYLPSVPFGCLGVGIILSALKNRKRSDVMWIYLALVFLCFEYFYPFYTAKALSPQFSNQHYWLPSWQPPHD